MEDIMDMSLDDYINSFKQSKPAISNNRCEESKFKEGRREDKDNDDDADDLLSLQCQEDDYVSLALNKFDPNIRETDNVEREQDDLRNKISGRFPKSSQQWRLMQPNIMNIRPAGMPPLVPSDAPPNGLNSNGNGNGNGNRNNWKNKRRNNWNNNNNRQNNNYRNNNNAANGRIQRFNSSPRNNLNSKNIKIVLEQLKQRNPMILYSSVGTPDLTIESVTDNNSQQVLHKNFTVPRITSAPEVNKTQSMVIESTDNVQSKSSEAIKSLLGVSEIGIRNDMMPTLAGKLLDILNGANPTIHKPMYDMKIQKEIHEIQKKPLLYKCPGGEVVSSDGVGVPDCKIQPKVSGISLNNRFA